MNFYEQAKILVDTPAVNELFKFSAADAQRYGNSSFGNGCLVAKQLLAGGRGARFVMVSVGGWDMHNNIYGKTGTSLYTQMGQLDPALASLIGDLKASPGKAAGKTLFDETLVVVAGEFGRTVGNLNGQAGRDHFAVYSAVFAGGGVRAAGSSAPGRTGATMRIRSLGRLTPRRGPGLHGLLGARNRLDDDAARRPARARLRIRPGAAAASTRRSTGCSASGPRRAAGRGRRCAASPARALRGIRPGTARGTSAGA